MAKKELDFDVIYDFEESIVEKMDAFMELNKANMACSFKGSFVVDKSKTISSQISAGEGVYDRLFEKIKKNRNLQENEKAIIKQLKEITELFEESLEGLMKEETELARVNNEIVLKIIDLEEEKMKENITKEPQRRAEAEGMFLYRKRVLEADLIETEEMKQERLEREKIKEEERRREMERIERDKRKTTEERQLEQLTELDIGDILFDSNRHHWSEGKSDFLRFLEGKRNVAIMVEDEKQNIFGGFVSEEIVGNAFFHDPKFFIFSLKQEGKSQAKKFKLRENVKEFLIFPDDDDSLFMMGVKVDQNCTNNSIIEIIVHKKGAKRKNEVEMGACQYNGDRSPLMTKPGVFTPKRILAYQMNETEAMRLEREEKERQAKQRQQEEKPIIERSLEELLGMKCGDVIFDTDIHRWERDASDFSSIVEGKSNLAMVVEDKNGNIFGGFVSKKIIIDKTANDINTCVFSIKKDGKFNPMKFKVKDVSQDFLVQSDDEKFLFIFGKKKDMEKNEFMLDVAVLKRKVPGLDYTEGFNFDYNGIENALSGGRNFETRRVVTYEMKETEESRRKREEEERQMQQQELERRKKEEPKMLEELQKLTKMKVGEVLFDSEIHRWERHDSEFGSRLAGKSNVAIVVEESMGNIFGCVIVKKIVIDEFLDDNDCYLFSLKRNGQYRHLQFKRKPGRKDFYLCTDNKDALFILGIEIDESRQKDPCLDLIIQKKDCPDADLTKPGCFDYGNVQDPFVDGESFQTKRVVAYQMVETAELKQQRQQQQAELERKGQEGLEEIKKGLEALTNMKYGQIVFNGDIHRWNVNDSEFRTRVVGKENLAFVIEDTEGNIFGAFVYNKIKEEGFQGDPNCFIWTIKKDGKFNPMKFKIKPNMKDLIILDDDNEGLFFFGFDIDTKSNSSNLIFLDIGLCKKNSTKTNNHETHCFEYGNVKLLTNPNFKVKRLLVCQMNETHQQKIERSVRKVDDRKFATNNSFDGMEYITKAIQSFGGLECKEIVFDSSKHKWSKTQNDFSRIVTSRVNLAVVIEDNSNNVFGGFFSKTPEVGNFINDSECFLFSIKRNGKYAPVRFDKIPNASDFMLMKDSDEPLFFFGADVVKSPNGKQDVRVDICLLKQDVALGGLTQQAAFDYKGRKNALTGDDKFIFSRMWVIQTTMTKEKKQPGSVFLTMNSITASVRDRSRSDVEIKKGLEMVSRMTVKSIVFDSNNDNWEMNFSVLGQKVNDKKNLSFIIQDSDGNCFGGFVSKTITGTKWLSDKGCFLFSILRLGEFNPIKYKQSKKSFSFKVGEDDDDLLFGFGGEEIKRERNNAKVKDICVRKKRSILPSTTEEYAFSYNGKKKVFCGKERFNVVRIIVYQMG